MASNRSFVQRCARKVRELHPLFPEPFDIVGFCDNLGRARRRPIHLMPVELPAAELPCGMWVSTTSVDVIAYARDTSPPHRAHIILHELAHMLCDHQGALGPGQVELLFPSIDPALVRRMLGRTSYTCDEEREAETLASLLQERVGRWAPESHWEVPAEAAAVIERLGRSPDRSLDHGTLDPSLDRGA